MILMRANPLQWPLERVGPENLDFLRCAGSPLPMHCEKKD